MDPAWAKISKSFTFDAAHRLEYCDSDDNQLHGHTYRVEIIVEGRIQPVLPGLHESGMVSDLRRITAAWQTVRPMLDHRYLNESLGIYPTAELIAGWIRDALGFPCTIRLHETPTSWVEVS